jgi:serine/threonine-protein kinase
MYSDAFAADPTLADNLAAEYRCRAARCAVLAGCGLSKDGATLGEAERTHWRKQARQWLQADLAARTKTLAGASDATRGQVRKMLRGWQTAPDLAGLRNPSALEQLSADERTECLALWNEVAAVLRQADTAP